MGKGSTATTKQVNEVDPATKAFIGKYREKAFGGLDGARHLNPYLEGLAGKYGDVANRGLAAGMETGLGGIDAYFDPYEDQVIGGVRGDFNYQRGIADNAAKDYATKAGAFGGDREAILRAQSMNDINRNETSTVAGLRSAGYSQAANQLLGERARLGSYGFAGAQGLGALGQHLDQNRLAWMGALAPGFTPMGQTSTNTQTQSGDLWGDIMSLGGLAANFIPGLQGFRGAQMMVAPGVRM